MADAPYETLSMRQQAYVDAVATARLEDKGHDRIRIKEEMEKRGAEPYSKKTMTNYKTKFSEQIEERVHVLANERAENDTDERVKEGEDGRPVLDHTWQDIQDRPVKGQPEETEEDVEDEGFLVPMDHDLLFEVIHTADRETAKKIYDAALEGEGE